MAAMFNSPAQSKLAPNPGAANLGAAKLGAPTIGAPNENNHESERQRKEVAPNDREPHTDVPSLDLRGSPNVPLVSTPYRGLESGAPTFGAVNLGAPDVQIPQYNPYRAAVPIPATTAQDGHTHGEQALFATLWRLARPISDKGRGLAIGERSLAKEVPMAYSSVQKNLRALVEKLAIEVRSARPNEPKIYIAYSYDEILRRRRAAGLTHVVRRTNGVTLVNPTTPHLGAPKRAAPNPSAPALKPSAPNLSDISAPKLAAHIRNKKEFLGTSTTTAPAPSLICNAIINVIGMIDEGAVARIIRGCRLRAPDATDDEIAEIAAGQARRISRMRNVDNHIGLLIEIVPKCFEGEPFARYRREKAAEAKRLEEMLE